MHDRQHIVRLFLLDTAVKQGEWYPRWVDGLGFGFGYALFNFYPPLIYYVAEAFRLVGFGYIWSVKLMIITGFLASFVGMYMLLNKLVKDKPIALLGAELYLLSQYHAALVYVRGAFAEFFGYNLVPWVFYGFYLLVTTGNIYWFAVSFALLILAHPFVAFPFVLLFIVFYVVYSIFNTKEFIATTAKLIASSLLGLGLSAFFWLPSMVERSFTLVNTVLTKQLADYRVHFVFIRQLFNSAWGYGGSIPGPDDGMSFEIGKLHILLIGMTLMSVTWILVRKKHAVNRTHHIIMPFIFLIVFSAFMVTGKSQFIWDSISFLWYLQFPWRFLVFVSFFSSVVGVMWLLFIRKNHQPLLLLIISLSALLFYGRLFKPEKLISGNDDVYVTPHEISWEQSHSSYEFMYKDVQTVVKGNSRSFVLTEKELPKALFATGSIDARGKTLGDLYERKSFSVSSRQGTSFTLNRSYFPGWKAFIDGKQTEITPMGPTQVMNIQVPQGMHTVVFKFTDTPIRSVGWVVTAFSVLLLFQPKKIYNIATRSGKPLKQS